MIAEERTKAPKQMSEQGWKDAEKETPAPSTIEFTLVNFPSDSDE